MQMKFKNKFILITNKESERILISYALFPVFLTDGTVIWLEKFRKFQIFAKKGSGKFGWITKIKY